MLLGQVLVLQYAQTPFSSFFFNLVFNRGGGHLNLLNKTIHRTGTMLEPEVRGA